MGRARFFFAALKIFKRKKISLREGEIARAAEFCSTACGVTNQLNEQPCCAEQTPYELQASHEEKNNRR
jgi:hypothetical protein